MHEETTVHFMTCFLWVLLTIIRLTDIIQDHVSVEDDSKRSAKRGLQNEMPLYNVLENSAVTILFLCNK